MSKKILIFTITLCILAIVFGGISFAKLNKILNPRVNVIQDLPQIPEDENKKIVTTKNILVLGTDKSGELADVIIICRYNPQNNLVSLLSIPRDTRVSYNNDYYKINSLYKFGTNTLKNKVETITKLHIDNYVTFSISSFREVVDILGGVDFEVPRNMKYDDPYQNLHINLKKGFQHLDGEKAEQLVRYRQYAMGDIDRINVQQDFIKELIKQKFTPAIIVKAPSLAKEILTTVQTDLKISELAPYLSHLSELSDIEIKSTTLPGDAQYIDKISYWVQDPQETQETIRDFVSDLKNPKEDEVINDTKITTNSIEKIQD